MRLKGVKGHKLKIPENKNNPKSIREKGDKDVIEKRNIIGYPDNPESIDRIEIGEIIDNAEIEKIDSKEITESIESIGIIEIIGGITGIIDNGNSIIKIGIIDSLDKTDKKVGKTDREDKEKIVPMNENDSKAIMKINRGKEMRTGEDNIEILTIKIEGSNLKEENPEEILIHKRSSIKTMITNTVSQSMTDKDMTVSMKILIGNPNYILIPSRNKDRS